MRRRHSPEERTVEPPLWELAAQNEKREAEQRAELGITRAATRAERIAPGWKEDALEAVRAFARERQSFLSEDVPFTVPEGSDPRAMGSVMRAAASKGYVVADGWAPANSSNRSAKVRWRSLICKHPRES
jgi:hypothetical protein